MNSFTTKGEKSLKILTKSENRIDYKNLSYNFLFPDSKFHIINFLKKYGTLFSLLQSLVTRKMTVDSANADQMSFIINLMHGYSDEKLYDTKEVKSEFLHNIALAKPKNVFSDTKNNSKKVLESFFPKNFNTFISKEQTNVLLNAMQLYNYRDNIIRLFENKNIRPIYAYNAKSKPEEYDEGEK